MLLQRNRPRRRKLFLTPGYIALSLFVWVASLCVLKHEKACFDHVVGVDFIPELKIHTIPCFRISNTFYIQLIPDKQLLEKQLVLIDTFLKSSQKVLDNQTSIQICLSDAMQWRNIIRLIDCGNKNSYSVYINEDAFVFYRKNPAAEKATERRPTILCGTSIMNANEELLKSQSRLDAWKKQAKAERVGLLAPFFTPHALLLLMLGLISFWKLRKQNT